MQPRGRWVQLIKTADHTQRQYPQQQQPDQRQPEFLPIEENGAPQKVYAQLKHKQPQTFPSLLRWCGEGNAGSADSHEGEKNCPHDGKNDTRRGKRRLDYGLLIDGGSLTAQPSGKSAGSFRCRDPEQIGFPLIFFHHDHPEIRICGEKGALFMLSAGESWKYPRQYHLR